MVNLPDNEVHITIGYSDNNIWQVLRCIQMTLYCCSIKQDILTHVRTTQKAHLSRSDKNMNIQIGKCPELYSTEAVIF